MSAEAATLPAGITGYVEAVTETRVLGWAWAPGQPARAVTAELLVGETILASTEADLEREDLRRNGIGDGRHAFALDIPDDARGKPLRVVARLDGAAPVTLAMPSADATAPLERIERALAALGNSQRLLHRNLQAVMLELREQRAMLTDGTAAAAAMEAPLRALDAGAMRIEERIAEQLQLVAEPRRTTRRAAWLAGIAALVVSGAASGAMLMRIVAAL